MDHMPASQRAQRLSEIAEKYGVVLSIDLTPLSSPKQAPKFSVPDDDRKADAILGQLKIEESQSPTQPKSLKRAFTISPKPSTYTYKELYDALSRVIDDNDLPGLAEVLLERLKLARRVSVGLFSRKRSSEIQNEPGYLIKRAAELCRHDLVQLLAPLANQENLDESLQIALGVRELGITETLLQYGANSSPHDSVFTQATKNGDFELLELLLRAPKRISDQAVHQNLLPATINGHFDVVMLLLSAGANADQDGGSALKCAVETGRIDIATSLAMSRNPPSGASLDQALKSIFTAPPPVIIKSYEIIEVVLCGGPEGDAVNEGLFVATSLADVDMMGLFLAHDANINYDRASALGLAIQKTRGDLVEFLLQEQPLRPELASELVDRIPEKAASADKVAILSKLLVNGASGVYCSKLLVAAADQNDIDTARLLLSRDLNGSTIGSVDYSAGSCLQKAVSRNNLEMVKLLALEGSPSKFSLSKAFSSIPPKISKDCHFLIVQTLLRAGTEGPEVDTALHTAVTSQHRSNRLIELLVQNGATVSDEVLSVTVKRGAVDTLKILLTGNVSIETCSTGIALAMKQHTHKVRYTIIKQLLEPISAAGYECPSVAEAVIDILQKCPEDVPLLRLLSNEGKANVNVQDGLSVILAAKNSDPTVLDIVLQSQGGLPNLNSVEKGLKCAIDLPLTDLHRTRKIESLLRRIKPQQAMDESLIKEIRSALAVQQSLSVIEVLLAAGADVNSFDGAPVFWAVRDSAIADLVLSKRPNAQSLSVGFRSAIKLTDPARYELCEKLLRTGAVGEDIDKALCIAAKEGPTALPLLQLLLPHANINYKDGRALRLVVQQGFLDGVDLLLTPRSVMALPATKVSAFLEAMRIKDVQQRYAVVERLTKAGIPRQIVSDALVAAVNSSDFQVTMLLLASGASVEHNGGQAIHCAASLGDVNALKLLVEGTHSSKPSLSSLTSGFGGAVALKGKDTQSYLMILQTLLEAGAPEEAINPALVEAVEEGDKNLELTELLCRKGASVEWKEGEALDIATRSASMGTLKLLLQRHPSQNVLKRVYRSTSILSGDQRREIIGLLLATGKAIDKHVTKTLIDATQQNPPDHQLIKLLLSHQVFDQGESMTHAASILDLATLELLVDTPKATPFIASAFNNAMKTEFLWKSYKGLSIVELMLKNGANGEIVGEALYHAVEHLETGEDDLARDFLDTLLRYGADVNYQRGLVLQRASLQVNVDLIQKLLPGATTHTKAMALPYLFTACEDTLRVLKAIQAFHDSLSDNDDLFFSFQHPDSQLEPVLFLALDKFPYKPQILRLLLDSGYNPNQWQNYEREPSVGMEPWPVLCWALDQPKKKISNINLELLIEEGANVNFISKSGMTPLVLAIQNQRSLIVERLISRGVKVTASDENGVTPLALASRLGNSEIMGYLLKAGAVRNDGSLHDAARDLRCDAMRVLMRYDHQADYPSERHDGRSALAELCLNAVNLSPAPEDLEEAITCLVGNGSDIRLHCTPEDKSEKSIFHYALDSADPLSILTVLLKMMWQILNDDAFLYKDKQYTYSLTKYVEKDVFRGPQDQKTGILRLLRNKRAVDKFWANDIEDEQPEDYCGAPPSIEEEVRVQKIRRKRRLEERENVMFRLKMKELTTVKEVEITEIQHKADIRRDHEKAQANLYIMTQHADTSLQLDLHAEGEKQRMLAERQNKEVSHQKAIGDVQVSTRRRIMEQGIEEERTKQMLQIEYVEVSNEREVEALRTKFEIEGSARQDFDSIDKRQHERELARIKMQKTLVDSSTALAGNLRNSGMNQRQIGYITGEVP